MTNSEVREIIEQLRRFEISDELGNGDFTICTVAANALAELIDERDFYEENVRYWHAQALGEQL